MADAFQCDRCGDFQNGEPKRTVPLKRKKREKGRKKKKPWNADWNGEPEHEVQVSTKRMDADLCDECAERLANFLDGKLGFTDPPSVTR